MRVRAAPALGRGVAFLAGVGFTAIPAAGPFLALLTWLNQRLELQRADKLPMMFPYVLAAPASGALVAVSVMIRTKPPGS